MKKKLVIANWKMYKTLPETAAYAQRFKSLINSSDLAAVKAVFCIPFTLIDMASNLFRDIGAFTGAQDMYYESEGPFTGEISAAMLNDAGARYVLLGERNSRETYREINLKVLAALESGISPIIRVGETLMERDNFKTEEVLKYQTISALRNIPERYIKSIIIAYVPFWAMGTDKYASVAEASGAVMDIRSVIREMYGGLASEGVQMIYGGNVNLSNARNLLATPNIDGVIIGRASLNPADFYKIIRCAYK